MTQSFYFYDLETSGFNPREARIMQFAGQRTDMDLKPLGDPHNYLIKMTPDVLPDPDAVLVTGITPQQTIADGITEAEFLKIFETEVATHDTIFVGFNNIRFDDEFIRFLHYRNFYDAYEWHWANERSRWDLLDVVRMTRALRPDGIKWPVDSEGRAANRLGLLTSINNLDHAHAHDALSDVQASIALARLLKSKQPKLFKYLLDHRDKDSVRKVVLGGQPFMYTSGKYPSEFDKTTAALALSEHPKRNGAIVYDLRHDPTEFFGMSPEKLAEMWGHFCRERPCPHPRLPVKTMQFNRCPAIAPIGVLDNASKQRLQLSPDDIQKHISLLRDHPDFTDKLLRAVELMDKKQQARLLEDELDVDGRLYDNFITDNDKRTMATVRSVDADQLKTLEVEFKDDRLSALLPLYKARNFPKTLTDEERHTWQQFCERKLLGGKAASRAATYFERLTELNTRSDITGQQRYILEELQLYGQSILPTDM